MPSPADRLKLWVESVSDSWKDRLRGWLLRAVGEGIESFTTHLEPAVRDAMRSEIQKLLADPNVPQATKNILNQALRPGNILTTIFAEILMLLQAIPVILGGSAPLSREVEYLQDRLKKTFRFDPNVTTQLWLRDKTKYSWTMEDLKDLGLADEQIEAVQTLAFAIPGVADIIRFAVREVYSPEIAKLFGQYEDFPEAGMADAEKAGLSRDLFTKQWAAHWLLPGSEQGFEMLHRNILKEDELKALLKALDIMPFWRDKLIQLSWNIPTRVDVRRFWEMRTINEPRLRELYTAMGYHGRDLDDYVLWTKIYTAFPDLLARYKNGWITLEDVKREVIGMGMSPERAETMIQEKIKKASPERVAKERDLTKADIIAGVKKGVITRVQGAELLTDIGYSDDEAVYLLDVNVPADEETNVKTKRELTKNDILNGLKTGVITETDALNKLLELRYTLVDAQFILKLYRASVAPPAEPKLKEASKADIVTGVKKGLITQEAGYLMLLDIGFAPDAALFILSVATEESPFSPISYNEFKELTTKYRQATGREPIPMSEELKRVAAELVQKQKEVDALRAAVAAEQKTLIESPALPDEVVARRKELEVLLHRAESTLAEVQSRYSSLVAEWKQKSR